MSQSTPYYILLDSETSQVERQTITGTRLNTFYGALTSVFGESGSQGAGSPMSFSPSTSAGYAPISSGLLNGKKLFAVLTRWNYTPTPNQPTGYAPFSSGEISAIKQFVSGGGGLLLMSNHGPFPPKPGQQKIVWCENDAALAAAFGFTLNKVYIGMKPSFHLLEMGASNFINNPRIANVAQIFSGVTSVIAHDGCGIQLAPTPPAGMVTFPIVSYPSGAYIWPSSGPVPSSGPYPSGNYFAAGATYGNGRVVVIANSGIIGDVGNQNPAPGLVSFGSNLFFVLNSLAWLAKIPPWSPWGSGPLNGG
jgi:hypothetical protein